jgi:hypothetical protein
LSNIYLDRLDKYIEVNLLPAHNQGRRRRPYRPYMRLHRQITDLEKRGEIGQAKRLRQRLQRMPSRDPDDPGYRRLRYCRYADDWLLGFTGPKREAEQIKADVGRFLHDELRLELSESKTLITHGRTQPARFLGYEIVVCNADDKHDHRGHRSINAQIGLKGDIWRVPRRGSTMIGSAGTGSVVPEGWFEEVAMAIVGGLDLHRKQITFDVVDTRSGTVGRGRLTPADRESFRRWLAGFDGEAVDLAVEGCTGWRFICRGVPGRRRAGASGRAPRRGRSEGQAATRQDRPARCPASA